MEGDDTIDTGAGDDTPVGPPSPFEANPDQPGSFGPPKDVFTDPPAGTDSGSDSDATGDAGSKDPHVDTKNGSKVDYGSLFASTVKTAGEVAKASVGRGLPGPVAAATAAAAAARQAAVNQVQAQPSAAAPGASLAVTRAAPLSTGAKVALGVGGVVVLGVLALAATKKGRR